MKRYDGLTVALFALVMGGAVAVAIASDITAPLCTAAKIRSAAPDKIEFGCLEFWLNRYQAMLAALVGAAVALYLIRPAIQQLGEMNRQTAAQLMERAERQALDLEVERDALRDFGQLARRGEGLIELYNDDNPEWALSRWHEPYFAFREELRTTARIVVAAELRSDPNGAESAFRTRFANNLSVLEYATSDLGFAFISGTSGHDPAQAEDFSAEQCEEAEAYFRAALVNAEEGFGEFAMEHNRAIKAAWVRRNRLAEKAFQ